MHIYQPIHFNSPLRNTSNHSRSLQIHPKPLQKLQTFSKDSDYSAQTFWRFSQLEGHFTDSGFSMFSKPPILYLNLHIFLYTSKRVVWGTCERGGVG